MGGYPHGCHGCTPGCRVIELLNVRNATAWVDSVAAKVVPGQTAAVDYVFFLHPTAIGHWLELMFPLFSALLHGESLGLQRTPDRLLVLHQKRGAPAFAVLLGAGNTASVWLPSMHGLAHWVTFLSFRVPLVHLRLDLHTRGLPPPWAGCWECSGVGQCPCEACAGQLCLAAK